jgi:hypothetical protein
MTIVNDDSRVINKLEASVTYDARVIIYDCHMFIVQATGGAAYHKYGTGIKRLEGRKKCFMMLKPAPDEGP